ncbi:MAG TPA: hypothetical protein VNO32_21415, partial [Candidatus Acidoferrum sp.]|nr:hypothetical protein [Candidatus Acidoferrum sp.]
LPGDCGYHRRAIRHRDVKLIACAGAPSSGSHECHEWEQNAWLEANSSRERMSAQPIVENAVILNRRPGSALKPGELGAEQFCHASSVSI